jgi:hypothetical protein
MPCGWLASDGRFDFCTSDIRSWVYQFIMGFIAKVEEFCAALCIKHGRIKGCGDHECGKTFRLCSSVAKDAEVSQVGLLLLGRTLLKEPVTYISLYPISIDAQHGRKVPEPEKHHLDRGRPRRLAVLRTYVHYSLFRQAQPHLRCWLTCHPPTYVRENEFPNRGHKSHIDRFRREKRAIFLSALLGRSGRKSDFLRQRSATCARHKRVSLAK